MLDYSGDKAGQIGCVKEDKRSLTGANQRISGEPLSEAGWARREGDGTAQLPGRTHGRTAGGGSR